ncbi:MAG: hypothetical protein K5873_06620 [Treponema sp.]|nr:hypothetical protein [Treponema sp.]
MPFKLIGTIILLILVTIFAGVNLDNKCDITFIFYTFHEIPVFMTVIISFAIGAVLMLPFTLGRKKKAPKKNLPVENSQPGQSKEESKTLFDFKIKREAKAEESKSKKEKKSLFGKKNKDKKEDSPSTSSPVNPSPDAETGAPV